MHATQTTIHAKRRDFINQPYELTIIEDEIHRFPEHIRKSLKLNKHKHKANFLKSKPKPSNDYSSCQGQKPNFNINVCKALYRDKEIEMLRTLSPKKNQDFQSTTDRMQDLRRRLSPIRLQHKVDPRGSLSEGSWRDKQDQRTVFLNIEKLNLIKIYSDSQKKTQSCRDDSLEHRYYQVNLKIEHDYEEDKKLRDVVVSLRKTLREVKTSKWVSSSKPKVKAFIAPFERYFYRDFIWKVAFSNNILLTPIAEQAKFKVYVGRGNNSQLVRSLLKRRSWWTFTQRWQQANLIWTQLKINQFFNLQSSGQHLPHLQKIDLAKEVINRNQYNLKIMNERDTISWDNYWNRFRKIQEKINQDLSKRKFYIKKVNQVITTSKTIRMQNHFPFNFIIGNKKALLYTMTKYYKSTNQEVFDYLPLSFHIKKGINDDEYSNFLKRFYERKKQSKKQGNNNIWICKPGQLTNRGNGIIVCFSLDEIKSIIKKGGCHYDGTPKTFILQEYIEKPFLYQRRKFDIRHYMLATMVNGHFKGYWFKRGYIRTSSTEYTLNHSAAGVHLTNDAVQKWLPDYGRFQKGNKLSYEDYQTYLDKQFGKKYNFFQQIYPQMKKMATDALKASCRSLDPDRRENNFQIFGLDFMIDNQFKPWLIEINSNPCLQLSCPLLADIIPAMVENTIKICIDPIVCPPSDFSQKRPRFTENTLIKNEFELVFDELLEEKQWKAQDSEVDWKLSKEQYEKDEDEVYQDDGQAYDD